MHVQEPKKVPYITKNYSKEPKKVLKMVLKTHLEPFREPLKVPPVGQPKNPFSKSVGLPCQKRKGLFFARFSNGSTIICLNEWQVIRDNLYPNRP